jgi:serine/threonine protein kinase
LDDYYCTSDAWSAQTSGTTVVKSINGWLSAKTQKSEYRFNKETGYVCTFSALVLKAQTAHIFHVGDSRIYRVRNNTLEQLTKDHRAWTSEKQSYLSRALGVNSQVEVDYQSVMIAPGDYFLLCTDGVYEHLDSTSFLTQLNNDHVHLDDAAESVVSQALKNGSSDNLTLQLIRIDEVPESTSSILQHQIDTLSLPPILHARETLDGYLILREMHSTPRSHVYLAEDPDTQSPVILKIPSTELRHDPIYLERILMEEWVARKITSDHVMKAARQSRKRQYVYSVMEYIEGITLKQWLVDNRNPDLETIRNIVEQIAKGLQAMHRKEILHQDLRPDNIMIDKTGTVKIIDFGGVRIAGLAESQHIRAEDNMQGTALYMAPEYFIGEGVSASSDQYSLAVIAYYMISGKFPYGTMIAKAHSVSAQKKLKYRSVLDDERETPAWIDLTLRKALHCNPYKRYSELSEFIYELRHPNRKFLSKSRPPLLDRNPILFWKSLSAIMLMIVIVIGLWAHIESLSTLTNTITLP